MNMMQLDVFLKNDLTIKSIVRVIAVLWLKNDLTVKSIDRVIAVLWLKNDLTVKSIDRVIAVFVIKEWSDRFNCNMLLCTV